MLRPCLGFDGSCHKLVDGGKRRCSSCESKRNRARDAVRGSSSQRGLGGAHRAQVKALVAAYVAEHGEPPSHCPSCGKPINRQNPITGEHGTPRAHGGTIVTALICKSCNSKAGATVRRTA